MEIISRQEALARGLKRYFTAMPCPDGHVAERNVQSKGCLTCQAIKNRKYRQQRRGYRIENREKLNERRKRYRIENREKYRAAAKMYYYKNKVKCEEASRRSRIKHADKIKKQRMLNRTLNRERILEYERRYRYKHRDKIKEGAKNRANKVKVALQILKDLGIEVLS
jgi:hypothetical protein